MKSRHGSIAAAVVVVLAARVAAAQTDPFLPPPDPPTGDPGELSPIPGTPAWAPEIPPPGDSAVWKPRTGYGVALTAGGGVGNYFGSAIRDRTGVQGMWNLRVAYGTRTYVGVEASYQGAAGSVNGLGLTSNSLLVRNGLEAALRINAPLMVKRWFVEPYVFGGVGWDHYSVTNTTVSADVACCDDVLTTPAGLGIDVTYLGLIADVRFAVRPTFYENLLNTATNTDLTNWTLGAQLGYEF